MTRDPSKNVMKRSRLRNKYLKNNSKENRDWCTNQRHFYVSLLTTKNAYYENLYERKTSDNKVFWKKIKPSLSKKLNAREKVSLSENAEIVRTEKRTAKVLKFVTKNINISQYSDFDSIIENVNDSYIANYVDDNE